jgi:RNA polymerase sigma factor (sigma-70 family)
MKPSEIENEYLEILQTNQKILFKICNFYTNTSEEKKDLFSEMVYQLWRSFPDFNNKSKVSTWIYRLSLNTALNYRREKKKHSKLSFIPDYKSVTHIPIHMPEMEDGLAIIKESVEVLSEIDKTIVILFLEGCSYKEIAEITGTTETNIGTKLGRIKSKLKSVISKTL